MEYAIKTLNYKLVHHVNGRKTCVKLLRRKKNDLSGFVLRMRNDHTRKIREIRKAINILNKSNKTQHGADY